MLSIAKMEINLILVVGFLLYAGLPQLALSIVVAKKLLE